MDLKPISFDHFPFVFFTGVGTAEPHWFDAQQSSDFVMISFRYRSVLICTVWTIVLYGTTDSNKEKRMI